MAAAARNAGRRVTQGRAGGEDAGSASCAGDRVGARGQDGGMEAGWAGWGQGDWGGGGQGDRLEAVRPVLQTGPRRDSTQRDLSMAGVTSQRVCSADLLLAGMRISSRSAACLRASVWTRCSGAGRRCCRRRCKSGSWTAQRQARSCTSTHRPVFLPSHAPSFLPT